MQRSKSLRRLKIRLRRRLKRLERRVTGVTNPAAAKNRDMVVGYVAIEALNAWALFSRSFYLSCALGARTERRKRVACTATTTDPLGSAITHYKHYAQPNAAGAWHRRDEPAWHDPNVLMTVCSNLGCSIQPQIATAFSLNQNVFTDLPVFRNFFAHRNGGTSQAARNVGPRYTLPTSLSPSDLLLSVSPGGTMPVIVEWLTEMDITADL